MNDVYKYNVLNKKNEVVGAFTSKEIEEKGYGQILVKCGIWDKYDSDAPLCPIFLTKNCFDNGGININGKKYRIVGVD